MSTTRSTKLVEGIPVPVGLDVQWMHERYVLPVYYGEKPELMSMSAIRVELPKLARSKRIMVNGGKTSCALVEITRGQDPDEDTVVVVGEGVVECSEDDNYVKATGRKRSLSKALSNYYANQGN